jgi:hypothetical protein
MLVQIELNETLLHTPASDSTLYNVEHASALFLFWGTYESCADSLLAPKFLLKNHNVGTVWIEPNIIAHPS